MGEKELVENQIKETITLIKKLDADGKSPSTVAWYYYNDVEEWRLIIAGPTFDKLIPKQEPVAYRIIIENIYELSLVSLSISYLKIIESTSPLANAMRFIIKTDPKGIVQFHFNNTSVNNIFIKDMVIFRSS